MSNENFTVGKRYFSDAIFFFRELKNMRNTKEKNSQIFSFKILLNNDRIVI